MNTTVQTSDLVLAASLIETKHKLDDLTVDTLGKGTFVFHEVAEKTLALYTSGGLFVEPKRFNATVVQLSRMCRAKSR